MRNRLRNLGVYGVVPACVLAVCGCVSDDGGGAGPTATPPAGSVVASPFSPASIRVLPLTHFERTEDRGVRVMLFFELLDQWGDTVKGAGGLEVRVAPAGADRDGTRDGLGEAARGSLWKIDLADLDLNASLYDPSTRAYRLALKQLPAWLRAMGEAETAGGVGGGGADGAGVAVEVYFRTVGADGRPAVLRDRFVLRGPS